MPKRVIIHIDEARCNGCGQCLPSCAEHALKLENGKVRVIEEKLCDGLGACLGVCPQNALQLVEREAEPFDHDAVAALALPKPFAPLGQPKKDWPLKLQLVPASGLEGAQLLLAADCAAAMCPGLSRHTQGKRLLLACPKLENKAALAEKLARIFAEAAPASVEILRMEVPCCCLPDIVRKAQEQSLTAIPVATSVITIHGQEELKLRPREAR